MRPAIVAVVGLATAALAEEPSLSVVFQHEGKDWYRIPSVVVTARGTVLAFASRRKGSVHDFGHDSDVVLRRSADGGRTWLPMQTLVSKQGIDAHHGPAVVEQKSGTVLKFCRYWPATAQEGPQRFVTTTRYEEMRKRGLIDHVVRSADDGATWTQPEPVVLTYPAGAASCGTGNGNHGIQLASGRLLIQGGYMLGTKRFSCLFLSDNGGTTWRLGAAASVGGSVREFAMAELEDGSILVNVRTDEGFRAVGRSTDGGESFEGFALDRALPDPRCHAGLVRLPGKRTDRLVFSNPANPILRDWAKSRTRLTMRLSEDGGRTWPHERLLHPGPSAYSDLVVLPDGTVGCLFEGGHELYGNITFARVGVDWVDARGRESQ